MDPQNIVLELDKYKNNSYLSHNFHPYPAKYIPQIPAEIIKSLSHKGDWVLDPFCGSGTTLVESRLADRNSLGVDVNPLACLISRVKTTPLNDTQLTLARKLAMTAIARTEADAEVPVPSFHNIHHWFEPIVVRELAAVKAAIRSVSDETVRDFLSVAFSSIIVRVSNQESDTRYKAVKKTVKPGDTAKLFLSKVADMTQRMMEFRAQVNIDCEALVVHADATQFAVDEGKFALALTSPPYMNSYDYYLYHKFRMLWLDFDYKEAQEREVGSRNKHNDHGMGIESYNEAIKASGGRVYQSLRAGGYYVVIVGDSILRGELIKMNVNFDEVLLSVGFEKAREMSFEQRRYTKTFTPNIKKDYKETYVLVYRKPY